MEYVILAVVIGVLLQLRFYLKNNRENLELISSVTDLDRGNHSERTLVLALRKLGIKPGAIFHDLYLKIGNTRYSQIDLVMATSVGLLVFEVKDYSGWIFGDGKSTYWTQVLSFGKEKYRFYNPILQNQRHIEALRKQSIQFSKIPMFSIVLFYGDCEIKRLYYLPKNVFVIYPNELNETIEYITATYPKFNYSNKREVSDVLTAASFNGGNSEIRRAHVDYVRNIKNR